MKLNRLACFSAAFLSLAWSVAAGQTAVSVPAGPIPPPSTTLAAQTGNNTSAANSFAAQTNGNAGAGNVSKVPVRNLLYRGANSKIYATWLGWFGLPSHMNVGYSSASAAQVHAQVNDMISRGISGAISAWYGPSNTFIDASTALLRNEAEAHPGQFEFAIMEDRGALGAAARSNACDVTGQIISDLTYIATQYESSPAYMRINGRPVVFFFNVDAFYIDWKRVLASIGGNPLIIVRGANGFTTPTANGGYSWVNIQQNNAFNPELNLQDAFFQAAQQAPQRVAMGATFKGFNDSLASWSGNRVIDQNCGQTWLQSFSEIGKFYSSGHQLPALQLVTWNDYEEGTAIEPGIDNCVSLAPAQSGATIQWTVNGNENTIDHYSVFISTNGINLSHIVDVPRGTHAVDLSRLKLSSSTTYFVYVKATGVSSFHNQMSPPLAYRPGHQPPTVSLKVSQSGRLTYTASTAGSSGKIAKTTINFGDGTVSAGPSATHTYSGVGTYLVTATVSDAAGASSVAVRRISAKLSSSAGVTIATPGNGATVNWPTPVVASAISGSPIASLNVLVDGTQAYAVHGDTLNTAIKVNTGTHQISVQALDASGKTLNTASLTVDAEPGDLPPAASITVTPMLAISPTTVLACTANSSDPDGFINSSRVQFSNGKGSSSPAVLETFAAPGSYTATATVTDEYGATNTTSTTFTVP